MSQYELLLSLLSPSVQMFSFTNWSVVLRPCFLRWYCNEFAGSISRWKFITLKILYTIVNYNPQRFYNSNTRITSTSSLTQLPNYNP
jgi:hypothetical protein